VKWGKKLNGKNGQKRAGRLTTQANTENAWSIVDDEKSKNDNS
jgi:hypothetical protein